MPGRPGAVLIEPRCVRRRAQPCTGGYRHLAVGNRQEIADHQLASDQPAEIVPAEVARGETEAHAAGFGRETLPFKTDVRKLKNLGLTDSLEVGYRLSPRGRAYLEPRS